MSQNENDKIFGALFGLLEWTFQISLTAQDKSLIESEVYSGWDNGDRTDHELVSYLLELHGMIWKVGPSKRDTLRSQARAIFKCQFGAGENNDRGRILAAIKRIVEQTSRGAIGSTALQLAVPATPVVSSAVVTSPGAHPTTQLPHVAGMASNSSSIRRKLNQSLIAALANAVLIEPPAAWNQPHPIPHLPISVATSWSPQSKVQHVRTVRSALPAHRSSPRGPRGRTAPAAPAPLGWRLPRLCSKD